MRATAARVTSMKPDPAYSAVTSPPSLSRSAGPQGLPTYIRQAAIALSPCSCRFTAARSQFRTLIGYIPATKSLPAPQQPHHLFGR